MSTLKTITLLLIALLAVGTLFAQESQETFHPGKPWMDTDGNVINAHGGGILFQEGVYYWFGEKRGKHRSQGVNVYSSKDLYNWKLEGLALSPVDGDEDHDIARGCVMERPKVIYNEKTGKYVMWFHLELKDQGYSAARAGVAVSDKVAGPYTFVHSYRPNGNMSRDMTLFQEEDGTAFHIYSSRENYDLRIARLSNDYLHHTKDDHLMFSEHREAPALVKRDGKYFLITSACTGWKPNAAAVHVAESLRGPWKRYENPMKGPEAEITFDAQSTFIFPVQGKEDQLIFMADRWQPYDLKNSPYIWLPIQWENGLPVVEWKSEWQLEELE